MIKKFVGVIERVEDHKILSKYRHVVDRSCGGILRKTLQPIPLVGLKELTKLFAPFLEHKLEVPRSHVPKVPYHWIRGRPRWEWKALRSSDE